MDMWEVGCSGGQNGGGALARVFPHHLRAAAGDPPDGHPHLAAPDGVGPRVRLDPAGHPHEVHLGGEVGAVVADPEKEPFERPAQGLGDDPRGPDAGSDRGSARGEGPSRAQRTRCCVTFVGKLRDRPEQTDAASHRITQCAAQRTRRPSLLSWGCFVLATGY